MTAYLKTSPCANGDISAWPANLHALNPTLPRIHDLISINNDNRSALWPEEYEAAFDADALSKMARGLSTSAGTLFSAMKPGKSRYVLP